VDPSKANWQFCQPSPSAWSNPHLKIAATDGSLCQYEAPSYAATAATPVTLSSSLVHLVPFVHLSTLAFVVEVVLDWTRTLKSSLARLATVALRGSLVFLPFRFFLKGVVAVVRDWVSLWFSQCPCPCRFFSFAVPARDGTAVVSCMVNYRPAQPSGLGGPVQCPVLLPSDYQDY